MTILKGELQADNRDVLYPHTSSEVVFGPDGKNVQEQINDLSVSRGYISSKVVETGSFNDITKSGKYFIRSIVKDSPIPNSQWHLEVIALASGWCKQVATIDNSSNTVTFERVCVNLIWSSWVEIATAKKIGVTLASGWVREFGEMYVYKNGTECSMTLIIKSGSMLHNSLLFNITNQSFIPSEWITVESIYGYSLNKCLIAISPTGDVKLNTELSSNERLFLNIRWNVE